MNNISSTLATVWRIAAPYFRSEDKWAGRALLAAVITTELAIVGLSVVDRVGTGVLALPLWLGVVTLGPRK